MRNLLSEEMGRYEETEGPDRKTALGFRSGGSRFTIIACVLWQVKRGAWFSIRRQPFHSGCDLILAVFQLFRLVGSGQSVHQLVQAAVHHGVDFI